MNASEAFKLTQKSWELKEQEHLAHIVGFENKIEAAAKLGRVGCAVAIVPDAALDFVTTYFQGLGYAVVSQPAAGGLYLISLVWSILPTQAVSYLQSLKEDKEEIEQIDEMLKNLPQAEN